MCLRGPVEEEEESRKGRYLLLGCLPCSRSISKLAAGSKRKDGKDQSGTRLRIEQREGVTRKEKRPTG